jgi:hypothetical protein
MLVTAPSGERTLWKRESQPRREPQSPGIEEAPSPPVTGLLHVTPRDALAECNYLTGVRLRRLRQKLGSDGASSHDRDGCQESHNGFAATPRMLGQ